GPGVCPPLAGVGGGLRTSSLWINEQGQLVAETKLGPVAFTKPIAYQEIDGKRVYVNVEYAISHSMTSFRAESRNLIHQWYNSIKNAGYQIHDNQELCIADHESSIMFFASDSNPQTQNSETPQLTYGFAVASYDRTKELVIDPLLASTFLGGSDSDTGNSIVIDVSGNVYITGYTYSSNYPTTTGIYDTSFNNSSSYSDAFIAKYSSDLKNLLVSTYLGGANSDLAYDLSIDKNGNVYVVGYTYSSDFPTSIGAYDTAISSSADIFISKFDNDLITLINSTYSDENICITGYTTSTDFPTKKNAYDTSFGGYTDVFLAKFNDDLTDLIAATYLGGSDYDYGRFMAVDSSGNICGR
ncbi:MAG: hypothetical protein E3K37_18625, partial [Candidatus Kuenenia sp.]|nr:hypothetical protein [Candidatus Kuenenia hertensis]